MRHDVKKVLFAAVLSAVSFNAAAQVLPEIDTIPTVIGIGVGVAPDYRGSDDKTGAIAPFFRHQFSGTERYIQLNATELTLNLLNSRTFRFGPVLNYHLGRDDDIDDAVVARMQEIKGTVEAGVFGEMVWADAGNPRNRFVVGVTLLADVGGEADGFRARFNARWWHQVSRAVDVHVGGGIIYADSNYTQTYFGVTPQNRGTSGLPFYNAGSGVNEYYMTLGALAYLSPNWVGIAGVRLSQLAGDAKDSPVVNLRGDKSQVIGGIGIGYMFR